MIRFYDTSALLNLKDELKLDENCYIPLLVLKELENIKTSHLKDDETKYYARRIVNMLWEVKVKTALFSLKKISEMLKKYSNALEDNNDSRIIIEAFLLSQREKICFYTGDRCQYLLITKLFPEIESFYVEDISQDRISDGYRYIKPTDEQWIKLYNNQDNENIFDCYPNEYLLLQDVDGSVKDITRWDGKTYVRLGYEPIEPMYCERVEPRNTEQKCYLDLLQNPEIPIVSAIGGAGVGKDYLALMQGLAALEKGEYNKIVYIRNNYEVSQTKEIGFLEGSMQKKTEWLLSPLTSIIGEEYLDKLTQEGKFEYIHLAFCRGITIEGAYIIVDEAQNLTRSLIKTIISRVGEGSKLVFCSDFAQRDSQLFVRSSGIIAMSKALTGNPNFGQVRLKKVERSAISMLAEKI